MQGHNKPLSIFYYIHFPAFDNLFFQFHAISVIFLSDRSNETQKGLSALFGALIHARIFQNLLKYNSDLFFQNLLHIFRRKRILLFQFIDPVRMLFQNFIGAKSPAISPFNRAGSTASPITSIRPIFSFLIWCSFA